MNTEYSFGDHDKLSILPGAWSHAEKLIQILMRDLNQDISGHVDWNLLVNSTGGPRHGMHSLHGLDAYIISNDDFTGFIKQPLFYAMAHFAKYILPGSRKIRTNIFPAQSPFISSVAYLRPDKKIAVILYNNHTTEPIKLTIKDKCKGSTVICLKPKSLNTFVYSKCKLNKRKKNSWPRPNCQRCPCVNVNECEKANEV